MTPTQTQQAIRIMQKHGQDGWSIESFKSKLYWHAVIPDWGWSSTTYRAVGPRKRVELKRGMEVKCGGRHMGLIVRVTSGVCPFTIAWDGYPTSETTGKRLTHYRWPNGDGTWLPIEGEPEIISMEGVE